MDPSVTPPTSRPAPRPATLVAIVVAVVVGGLVLAGALALSKRWLGGPDATSVATSSLEAMRAQNRLVPFVARYVSVVSSRRERLGGLVSTERTLVLPGDVRYEIDLSRLRTEDVTWDAARRTLTIDLPPVEIAGPEVDLAAAREFGEGGLLSNLTRADEPLDSANRARAVADLRRQAAAELPMRLAREAARQAVERSFAMPLAAAGIDNVTVVARFAGSARDPSTIDRSRSYEDVLRDARAARQPAGE